MEFKQIASYDNYMLANMTMGLLTENNIKCQMKDEYLGTMVVNNQLFGGIKLLVEEKDYDRALAIIKEAEQDHLKDIACPKCGINSLVVEEKISNPTDTWGKLKNQVLFGQTSTYSKRYRCTKCNNSLVELPPSF